jgi:thiol-disulfide isomerase/thioredoxin
MVEDVQGLKDTLKANERVIALFYASWCPFCVDFLRLPEVCGRKGLGFLVVQDDQEQWGTILG